MFIHDPASRPFGTLNVFGRATTETINDGRTHNFFSSTFFHVCPLAGQWRNAICEERKCTQLSDILDFIQLLDLSFQQALLSDEQDDF